MVAQYGFVGLEKNADGAVGWEQYRNEAAELIWAKLVAERKVAAKTANLTTWLFLSDSGY
jgi:hypothetical protein